MAQKQEYDRAAAKRTADEIEESYHFHREWPKQTLSAYVSKYRDDLADEFHSWRGTCETEKAMLESLLMWEEVKFGAALYASAHGMLWFAVRGTTYGGPKLPDKQWQNTVQRDAFQAAAFNDQSGEGEPIAVKLTRICKAAGAPQPMAAPLKSMPDVSIVPPPAAQAADVRE